MHINSLPDEIIANVFEHINFTKDNNATDWKNGLNMLAVCRLWRAIAIRLVFGKIWVSYNNTNVLNQQIDRNNLEEPINVSITTNADIISSAGCIDAVKHLNITVFYRATPFPGLFAVLNRLKKLSRQWPSVRSLEIKLEYNITAYVIHQGNANNDAEDIASTVHTITHMFPNVTSVKYSGIKDNTVAKAVYSQLMTAYSEQATELASVYPLSLTNGAALGKLTRLEFDVRVEEAHQLLLIIPETLVSLHLREIPYHYKWANFSENNLQDIEFPNLRNLEIQYAMDNQGRALLRLPNQRRSDWPVLRFPKLKSLKLSNNHSFIPLVEYGVLPKELERVDLSGSMETLVALENKQLPAIKKMSMDLAYSDSDPIINPFDAINRIARKARSTTNVSIFIRSYVDPAVLSNPACSSLTMLTIFLTIDGDIVPKLIGGLPNLKKLVLPSIINVNLHNCSMVAEFANYAVNDAQPLNTSLENMILTFVDTSEAESTADVLVKYLLPRLPSLTGLRATHVPEQPIRRFVNEFKEVYPHLDKIKFMLWRVSRNV